MSVRTSDRKRWWSIYNSNKNKSNQLSEEALKRKDRYERIEEVVLGGGSVSVGGGGGSGGSRSRRRVACRTVIREELGRRTSVVKFVVVAGPGLPLLSS